VPVPLSRIGCSRPVACRVRQAPSPGLGRRILRTTTEIAPAAEFWYAEDYHQQYLAKNPNGYGGIGGTGVSRPIGIAKPE
jgi:peptide methionine sulfoxide reductase MsrA